MDLRDFIRTINVLNIDEEESTIATTELVGDKNFKNTSYVVSDADEEIIILVEFQQIVDLHSVKLYATPILSNNDSLDISPPKLTHIYMLDNLSKNFDDIQSMKPDKTAECSIKKLKKGQRINLKKNAKNAIKFSKTKFIALYIQSNQNDTENTYLNRVVLSGKAITNSSTNDLDFDDKSDNDMTQNEKKHALLKITNFVKHFEEMESNMNIDENQITSEVTLNEANNNSTKTITQHNCKIANCPQLYRIITALNTVALKKHNHSDNSHNTLPLLNDYLHLMEQHNSDEEFEYIFNRLGFCDIAKCNIFRRRGNRNGDNICYSYLLDKIHCHYHHCFDTGNRLFAEDKIIINSIDNDDDSKSFDQQLINNKVIKTCSILSSKRTMCKTMHDERVKRANNKYNVLFQETKHDKPTNDANNDNMYKFGIRFKYGYDAEHYSDDDRDNDMYSISPSHSSLKEELTTNTISAISMHQFNNEYAKAALHLKADYCKEHFSPIGEWYKRYTQVGQQTEEVKWIFGVDNVLSVMIYCNYDILQYEFSKTYREYNGKKHNQFYWLGKFLKI
eukprot:482333_1